MRAVAYAQRAQHRADVDLDRAFGQIQRAADDLVGHAAQNQPQDVDLPFGQTQAAWIGVAGATQRWLPGTQCALGRNGLHGHVDVTPGNHPQCVHHRVGVQGLGDVPGGAHLQALQDGLAIEIARQHDHRAFGTLTAQRAQGLEPVGIGKLQIEQRQIERAVLAEPGQSLGERGGGVHAPVELQIGQCACHCVTHQRVVVDDQETSHGRSPSGSCR